MKCAVTLNLFVECDYFKCYHEMLACDFHVEVWMKSIMRIGSRVGPDWLMWSRYRRGARKPLEGEMQFLLPLVFLIGNRWFQECCRNNFDLYDRAVFLVAWLGMHNILVPYWLLTDVIFKSMIYNLIMLLNIIFNKSCLVYLICTVNYNVVMSAFV